MALPTVSKTYTYNVNNAVTAAGSITSSYQNFWYKFKTALKTAGWTVRSSSDGVSASTSDLWTSPSAITIYGNPRPWIVLRHPVSQWDLFIGFGISVGYRAGTISVSRGGFSQSGFSTSSFPTTVLGDEQVFVSSANWVWGNNDPNYVWHYVCSTDGEIQRFIVCVSDIVVFAIFMDVPQSPVTNWNGAGSTTPPCVAFLANAGDVTTAQMGTITYSGTPAVTRTGTGAGTALPLYMSGLSYAGNLLCNGLTVPNDLTGEYPLVSISYISNTTPYRGLYGNPYDLWFGVSNMIIGTTYPADTSRQFIQFGTLVIRWNGSVPVTR